MRWVLEILQRRGLFAGLKKCQFRKNQICFLGYLILALKIKIKDKQIEVVKNWPKLTLKRDI